MTTTDVDHVRVSQASRRDAHNGPLSPKYESFSEEFDALVAEKKALELRLSTEFSSAAFTKAQHNIRKTGANGRGDSGTLRRWFVEKSRMSDERAKVVARKLELETRMAVIKQRAKQEQRDNHAAGDAIMRPDGTINHGAVLLAILDELVAMNRRFNKLGV